MGLLRFAKIQYSSFLKTFKNPRVLTMSALPITF